MRRNVRPSERAVELAESQYGVLSHAQLRGLEFSAARIESWCQTGRLHRVHRGVFAVGHAALSRHGRCLAAVHAGGEGAVLSHASAAWLWGILRAWSEPVEVAVPSRGHGQNGIRVHRAPALAPEDRTEFDGIPVTTVARTLLDHAVSGPRWRLRQVVDGAKRRGLLDLIEADALLRRLKGTPGTRRLRDELQLYRTPEFSRARSELLLSRAVREAGLPRPSLNRFVNGYELDAYWAAERFAVEVDGWETHQTRRAFEEDRERQERLKLAGVDLIRITARRLEREPEDVARTISHLLTRRRRELRG